ncbi:MAG: GAF domain-containing protein [Anaerolineales bacterium]|nr:GAF domain-containing protein [Anaerolineales bacterium]
MDDGEYSPNDELTARALLHRLPGMVYRRRFDAAQTVLFAGRGAFLLTGYLPAQLVNSREIGFGTLIEAADLPGLTAELNQALAEKRPYHTIYRIHTAGGRQKWVLDRGTIFFTSPDDTIPILDGFVTDHDAQIDTLQQLEQTVIDRTRKLSALYDVLEAAADPTDLKTTITRTLHRVLKAIESDVGAIHLVDKSGEFLQLAAQQGMLEAVTERIHRLSIDDNELAGWIVRHNEPILIPSIKEDARTADFVGDETLDVFIGVPIMAHEQVRGVLTVLSEDISRYTAKEAMALLVSVGEQVGVVVENARLRQQAEQLMVLEERNRLARELHDSVTQSLYSVTLFAEAGRALTHQGEAVRAGSYFTDILETGRQALKEMRLLVHRLRPSLLEKEGLVRALQHRLNAVEGRAGIKNQLIVEMPIELSSEIEECLYHICHEALNNAIKHAVAAEVWVYLRLQADNSIQLQVIDNGNGFDPELVHIGGGLGLISMRERAALLGGTVTIKSIIGEGTTITVWLPGQMEKE